MQQKSARNVAKQVVSELKRIGSAEAKSGMAGFGINTATALGVPVPELRKIARKMGFNHELALELWDTGVHEARLLATMIEDPKSITNRQMELWVRDLDSWDVCDSLCGNLLDKTKDAYMKAAEWSKRDREYVRRAGFAMMAVLAVHDKEANDQRFINFIPLIVEGSDDERNFVKKAVSWALRNIGKRNKRLNREAIAVAERIGTRDSASAKWVASDVIRELRSAAVVARLDAAEQAQKE
ncbi:MAG: DNA alkylation repair protein [Candidatus Micrarchaeota archaeon]|nr:DNA alkylation repair protein [Candidatus Micrarchaeota archaeon]